MPSEVKHQSSAQLASKVLSSLRVMSYGCAALFTIMPVLLECPEHMHTFGIRDLLCFHIQAELSCICITFQSVLTSGITHLSYLGGKKCDVIV